VDLNVSQKMKFLSTALLSCIIHSVTLAQEGAVVAPVYKPTFMTGYDSFSGGTAFVASNPAGDGQMLVTALHLFGPACGLEKQLTPEEVCKVFHAVTGIGMADYKSFVTSCTPLLLKTANVSEDDGCAGDLAIYRLPAGAVAKPLVFSKTPPKVGDKVYVIGRQRGGEKLERLMAEVVDSDSENLVYKFARKGLETAGTSGAPVVNDKGEVVGMNTGGGQEDDVQFGYANPAKAILGTIAAAENNG
jgi:hypothetical protein